MTVAAAAWSLVAAVASAEVQLAVELGRADASGYLQTPAGGNPGTSSIARPTLDETDSGRPWSARVAGRVDLPRKLTLRLSAERLRLNGDGTAASEFFTQGEAYPAGTALRHRSRFDFVDLGVARNFALGGITLTPELGLNHFRFNYDLVGDNGEFAVRDYSRTALYLAIAARRPLTERVSLTLAGSHTVKLSANTHERRSLSLTADYRFGNRLAGFARLASERLDYEDEQTFPNHLRVKRSPYLGVGVSLTL